MEKREFRLHTDILWSIIQSQAGTLQKALLELVMNSLDANATSVSISLDEKQFRVVDDGKGFTSRHEIESFFETFGTPHEKGDAKLGRFRMGRGQIMAFARNDWQSGQFKMAVDIRDKGLAYGLSTVAKPFPGCEISGTLYEELRPSVLLSTCRALEDLCKFTPIPVILNGKCISVDMTKQKWTFEDDDAYYSLRSDSRALSAFNLGVGVCEYPASDYGTGGIVVSKQQLEVNFARNDILLSKCEVWKRIAAKIRAHSRELEGTKPTKNEPYREMQATQLLSGEFESKLEFGEAFRNEKLLTDVTGKHHSFTDVVRLLASYSSKLTMSPSSANLKADKVHQSRIAFVLSRKTLERFQATSLKGILDELIMAYHSCPTNPRYRGDIELNLLNRLSNYLLEFKDASGLITETHTPVDMARLTRDEKEILQAIQLSQNRIFVGFYKLNANRDERSIKVGTSETANAWTDGKDYIFINRNLLKIGGYPGAALIRFNAIGTLLAHEYVHTADDSAGHVHDTEFYEMYERLTCATDYLGEFTNEALNVWLDLRKRSEKSHMRRGENKELDRQAALARGV